MSERIKNITVFLRYLAFIIVVYTIIVHPVTEPFKILDHDFYELTDFNGEEERNEKEKQEEDSKNEEIEFHTINYSYHYYANNQESSMYMNPKILWNFSMEILIPPPQRI